MFSFTIARLYKSFSLKILLYKYFNHFLKQPPEEFHKKAILKYFVIFTGKHLWWSLFFNKVEGHQTCGFIKKRLQYRYFLVNFGKFIRTTILKKISEQLHFWKVFCENIFFRLELSKRSFWWLAVWKVAQISQHWTKMFPIIMYNMRREKIKFLKSYWKTFHLKSSKIRKYFFAHQYQNFRKFQH